MGPKTIPRGRLGFRATTGTIPGVVLLGMFWAVMPGGVARAEDAPAGYQESGTASFYRNSPRHQRTASGAAFRQVEMTAAHAWLPFGTKIRVTLAETGRDVVVTVTDRLMTARRVVDLSLAAARELGMVRQGVAEVLLSSE